MTETIKEFGAALTAGAMFFEAKAGEAGHENERVFASEIAEAIRSVLPNPSAITAPSACQEMLEALKEGEPYVEAFHSLMSQKEARKPVMAVLRRMRAAIAKAERSQP